MHNIYIYIAIMAGVSFLIRVLPLTIIKKQITNVYVRSFLYYVPYVTLSVMTFPAIMDLTGSLYAGLLALAAGILLAVKGVGLFPVALCCSAVVFVFELIL